MAVLTDRRVPRGGIDAHAHHQRHDRRRRRLVHRRRPHRWRDDRADRTGPRRLRSDRRRDDRCDRPLRHPRRDRRPHPHGAAVRRDVRQGHVRDRDARRGVRRHDLDRRLRRPGQGPVAARGPRRLARQGRRQRGHRLRLPHDHERRQRRDARRDGRPGGRGRPRLQAVHRLSGRLLQRRRRDLPGDAADRQERRADHDARRERDGDRRRRCPDRRGRHDRSDRPRPGAQGDLRGRGDQPGHPPGRGRRRAGLHRPPLGARCARIGARRARARQQGLRRDVPAVPLPVAR